MPGILSTIPENRQCYANFTSNWTLNRNDALINLQQILQDGDVLTSVHRALKMRAASEGKSMSELLLEQMTVWLELPSELELRERLRDAEPFSMAESSAQLVRKERDAV